MNQTKVFVISDIHLKKENQEKLSQKIKKLVTHVNILSNYGDIILFSGDLAYSGKREEYDVLYELLHPLTNKLKVFLCPGNHDVNFSQPQEIRDIVINSLGDKNPSPEIIEQLTTCQKEYFEFSQKLSGTPSIEKNKLAQVYFVEAVDKNIQIISLNTAWISKLKEKSGTLFFPTEYLPKSSSEHFKIAFCHHPLSWLEANKQKQVRNYLRKDLDLVITGHEHIRDSFKVSSSTGESIFIESISFDDPHMDENGFLTIELEDTLKVKTFIWKENDFFEKSEELEYSAPINKIISSTNEFQLKNNFIEQLSELGAGFTHKFKETLRIDDVFIYPNLKLMVIQKQN